MQARQREVIAAKRQEIAEAQARASMMNMNAEGGNTMNQPFGGPGYNMMADLIKMQAQALARSAIAQQSTGDYLPPPHY